MMSQRVILAVRPDADLSRGTAGLKSQCPGQSVTVTGIAVLTGGVGDGGLIDSCRK